MPIWYNGMYNERFISELSYTHSRLYEGHVISSICFKSGLMMVEDITNVIRFIRCMISIARCIYKLSMSSEYIYLE